MMTLMHSHSPEGMAAASRLKSPASRRALRCFPLMFAMLGVVLLPACKNDKASSKKSKPPAKVEKLPLETEISRITLTARAAQRLGITLTTVLRQQVQQRRTFGGEVTIPGGKSIIVSAPIAGAVAPPDQGSIPLPGERVKVGAPVLSLVPFLTPERYVPTPAERVQMANARATLLTALTIAKGDVQRTQAEVDAAKITLTRAEQLLTDKVGSAKAVDDARAQLNIAVSTLEAAQERQQQLAKLLKELDANGANSKASPLVMGSPQSGVIRTLAVSQGQTVAAGATLFEVLDTSTMWIRVPLYVGVIPVIDSQAEATIVPLGERTAGTGAGYSPVDAVAALRAPIVARPVVAPPSADPLSTTADLYYEVNNSNNSFRPGQRVGVELKLQGAEEGLVVSAKAVLYDIYGGTWVYVKSGESAFQRQRVLIRFTANGLAVLDKGPPAGTVVVVDGAAELYGTEFGAGK